MKKTHFKISKNILTFILIIVLLFFFFIYFFYVIGEEHGLPKDFLAHYNFAQHLLFLKEMSLQEFLLSNQYVHVVSYPVWHVSALFIESLIRPLQNVFSVKLNLAVLISAITTSIYTTLTFGVLSAVLRRIWSKKQSRLVTYIVAFCLVFVNPFFCEFINEKYYLGQLVANVWHNPTLIAMKPFALISISIYIYLLEHRILNGKCTKGKKLTEKENALFICFGSFFLLSGLAKPNFFQVFAPALFIYCIIDVMYTKGKSFWFDFKTALSIIPTCILAIFQLNISIGTSSISATEVVETGVNALVQANIGIGGNGGGPTGIGMGFLVVWKMWTENIVGSAMISLLFPMYIFIICRKFAFKRYDVKIIGLTFVSAMYQFVCFYLRYAPQNGDFAWGLYTSIFLLFVVSAVLLFEYKNIYSKNIKWWIGLTLFLGHFISGLGYFAYLYISGAPY